MTELIQSLKDIVGPAGFREGDDIDPKAYRDPMRARKEAPRLLLRPANTDEVSRVLALCHEAGQPIAPQGGMTGLVSAAAPFSGEIALSLERMHRVLELDRLSGTITVEAGTPLQTVQEFADAEGFLFPLDLGARGTCTVGGNLATNAGGNRVIRYGMARDLVVGLEAVLADGTVIDNLHKLRKNNTGYDLKQLFIGSEGTLGIITRAVFKLLPKPTTQAVAFCALEDFDKVAELLTTTQAALGGNLTAFEVLWQNTYQPIATLVDNVHPPLPDNYPFYVLVESMGTGGEQDKVLFESALENAIESGLIADAVISQSEKDIANLWRIRDAATEIPRKVGFMHAYDVSVEIGQMDYFGREVEKRLNEQWPGATVCLFGHIGDGNLHILFNAGAQTRELHQQVDALVYTLVRELHGAVSAEHGIGLMKRDFLSYSKSPAEIALMQTLKRALDPNNILSPGRVLEL